MKAMKKILLLLVAFAMTISLYGCVAKSFEKEINVVFEVDGEYITSGKITQFDSIFTPELPESYIPLGYKFLGWTYLDPNEVSPTDPQLKNKYIPSGKMVHYKDVCDVVSNSTVKLSALMFDKNDIPVEYHYVVLAWYNKEATSGLNQERMNTLESSLKAYLKSQNVSDEDIATIVIRGYDGNVGASTGKIVDDDDVDIMFGWGSAENVTTTGVLKPEMLKETEANYTIMYNDTAKQRTIHRLSDKETAIIVYNWLKSEECRALFN